MENMIAGLASFFIPGLGQLLQQRFLAAIIYFLLAGAVWWATLGTFGWVINIIACISALRWNR